MRAENLFPWFPKTYGATPRATLKEKTKIGISAGSD